MPMKLDAHIENMYSMSSDLKMSTMKSDAGRPPPLAWTEGSAGPVCAAAGACFASSAAAAPVAAPVRKLRRSTPGLRGFPMRQYPSIVAARCQFRARRERTARFGEAPGLRAGIESFPVASEARGSVMERSDSRVDRRRFLRGAVAAALAAPAVPAAAQSTADVPPPAPPPLSPSQAAQALAAETAPLVADGDSLTVDNPGSDFMVDVLKTLGFEHVVANPASSFRGLHESFINYGGNTSPEWLTCTHEQAAVNIANGYYAVAAKPMAVVTFAPSGLQHAAMGIFGAFSGRTPTYLLCANIPGGEDRRPLFDWGPHAMTDPAAMVRDMLKWDDTPASLQHFAESAVRAYRMAMMEPRGPVMLVVDAALQEDSVPDRGALRIPKLALASPPAGDSNAVAEVARLLVAAENPVVLAGDVARDEAGMRLLVELAETLAVPVQGGGRGMPNQHPLAGGGNVRSADVILALNEDALYGRLNRFRDQTVRGAAPLTKADAKILSISSYD